MTFLFLALGGGALIIWIYGSREVPVSGRWLLAAARALSIALVVLLLWNPDVPGAPGPEGADLPWLLLDGSLSMGASGRDSTAWVRALHRARAGEWAGVTLFGDRPGPAGSSTLDRILPGAPRSRLEPALERSAEAGARRVVVLSDSRIEDADRAVERAEALGLILIPELLDTEVVNAGLAEVSFPATAEAGDSLNASVAVFAEGLDESDSLRVEVREEGRLVASERVPAPAPGRLSRIELTLSGPGESGPRRYLTAVSAPGDVFPDDDRRPAWVEVDPQERGVLLLSLRPDWEPRFLLPVLERATGLEGEAFLSVGDGRFIAAVEDSRGPGLLGSAEVRRRLAGAQLLVVHGLSGEAPVWVQDAMESARRVMVFPVDRPGGVMAGVRTGAALPGEWYPPGSLPPSPLAGDLAGIDLSRLPPLSGVLPFPENQEAVVPLLLQRRRGGSPEPGMALLEEAGARRAVILARGFWRWGFREGAPREAYRRLWAGVARWLLGDDPQVLGTDVRPRAPVVPRGASVLWQAPGLAGRTLRLQVADSTGSPRPDTLVVAEADGFRTAALPPGAYSFRAWEADTPQEPVGEGRFDVESFTPELMTLPTGLEGTRAGEDRAGRPVRPRRPLRTHPLPYLMVLGLLSAEWIGRRRRGLR